MKDLKNKVSLIGRLGKKPELQNVGKDYKLTKFNLATNEPFKDKVGKWQEQTQWHNLLAWGNVAEKITALCDKGLELMIEGRLVNSVYEKDGEKRYKTDIEVTDFLILSKKNHEKVEPIKA